MKRADTIWHAEEKWIETILSGDIEEADVIEWEQSLERAFNQIPAISSFKILVDLFGFKAVSLAVHKRYRDIIPFTLSRYNWKVGYVDLFEEASQMTFSTTRNISCVAAVHVHQDEEKIGKYQERFGRANEQFMTDPVRARQWIRYFPIY